MRRYALRLAAFSLLLAPLLAGQPPRALPLSLDELRTRLPYAVAEVVDGDTIKVTVGGQAEPVRLIGVDTPETVHPTQPVEAFGREASAFTKSLLDGHKVWLEYDGPQPARDRYGRLLAYVYRVPDGVLVNLEIIRAGFGEAYVQYPFRFMELFRAVEREARAASRGLWASGGAEAEQAVANGVLVDEAAIQNAVAVMDRTARYLVNQPAQKPRARELWAAALQLDPDNGAIIEALRLTQPTGPASSPTPPAPGAGQQGAQQPPSPAGPTVYVTQTGERYHRAGCRYLRGGGVPLSLAEAQRRGLTACGVCKP